MSSLNEDKSALEGFFKEFDGNNFESAMSSHLGKASDSAREFAQKVVTANSQVALSEQETSAKIKEYSAQQSVSIENKVSKISSIGSKLKGFGANLLTSLASAGAWAVVGLAIEGVAKGIDYLANKDKYAAEDAQKLTDSYKQQEDTFRSHTSTLKGMQSEFNELSKGVDSAGNNVNLSTEQYKQYHEIANQIAQIEPSLASGYDSEGNAILVRNNALQQGIDLQQQELKLKQQEQTEGKDADTTWNGYVSDYKNNNKNYTGDSVNSAAGHEYDQVNGVAKSFFEAFNYSNGGINVNPTLDSIDKIKKAFSDVGLDYDKITNGNLIETEKLVSKRQELINKLTKENNLTAEQKKQVNDIISGIQKENSAKEISIKKETDFLDTWVSSSDSTKWYQDMSKNGVANIFNSQISNYLKNNPNATLDDAKQKAQDLGNAYESIKDKLPTKEFKTFADAVKNGDVTQKQVQDANQLVQTWRKKAEDFKKKGKTDVADVITAITDGYAQEVQSANKVIDSNNQAANSFTSLADAEEAARSGLSQAQESFDSYSSGLSELIKLQQSTGTGSSLDPTAYKKLTTDLPDIDFSNAVEYHNGGMQFNLDELQKLTKAYAENQEEVNNTNIAIEKMSYDDNATQIAAYSKQIETNTYAQGENKDSVQGKIDSLQQEQDTIQGDIQQYEILNTALEESTSNYAKWQNAQKSRDSGDMFTDVSSAKKQITDGLKNGKVGSQKFQAAVEFLIPDTFEPKDQARVKKYLSKLNRYITEDSKGNVTDKGMQNFMSDMVTKGFAKQDNNGKYQLVGKRAMSEIAKGMNITPDMAKAIFGNLENYGFKFDFADEDPTKNLKDKFASLNQQIKQIQSDSTIEPKVKSDELTKAYSSLRDLNQLQKKTGSTVTNVKIKAELEVDSQIETAQKKVDDLKKKFSGKDWNKQIIVDADCKKAQDDLDNLKQTKNQLSKPTVSEITVQINKNGDDVDKLKSDLKVLQQNPKDTKVVQGLMVKYQIKDTPESDKTQVEKTIQSKIDSLNKDTQTLKKDLEIKWAANTTAVDASKAKVESDYTTAKSNIEKNPVQINANNTNAINAINSTSNALNTLNGNTATVHINEVTNKSGSGSANGTAHASGNAHANGTWGEPVGGKTLVGELGSEIVVDPMTGKWHTVGDNGAEFVNIPRGAIVFNHVQTKDILENGYVTSRGTITNALANGNAHVNGTALASGNAMVTGGGYLPSSNPAVSGYYEGDNGTRSTKKNTTAKKENTKAIKENAKAKKDSSDATKEENKALDDYTKKLEHEKNMGKYDSIQGKIQYVQKLQYAYKNLTKTQDEKWKLEEEIYSARKEYQKSELDDYNKLIAHEKNMGQFDSLAGQTQYVQKLQYALKNLATTQDERWQLQEEIYSEQKEHQQNIINNYDNILAHEKALGQFDSLSGQLEYVKKLQTENSTLAKTQEQHWKIQEEIYSEQKQYEENAYNDAMDRISYNESLGKYTGNLIQKYKDLASVQQQFAKTGKQKKEIEEEIYSNQKNIISEQEQSIQHLVAIGKLEENSIQYVSALSSEISKINNTKGLSSGDKKSLTDSLEEQYYSALKSHQQYNIDKSYSQMQHRVDLGQVKENSKSYLQNLEEIQKMASTQSIAYTEEEQWKIEKDIYDAKKAIAQESQNNLQYETETGKVRENSLEYLNQIKDVMKSISDNSSLGVEDKKALLDPLVEKYYSSQKSYVQQLENSLSDESIVGSYGYQIKQIQDKIDAINKQNDSLSKQIALEKAKAAWEEAQNQKSVAVYRQGYGFVYTVDQKNVTEKKEAYEDAERAKRIQDLTDQKDAIEKEMNSQKTALQEASKHLDGYQNDSMSSWNSISKQIKNCISDINGAIGLQTSTAQQNYTQQENDLKRQTKAQSVEYNKQLADLNNFYQQYKQITQQNPIDSNLSNIKPAQEQGSDLGSTVDYSDMNQSDSQSQMMQSQNNTIGNMKTHLTQLGTNSIEYGKTMNINYAKGMTENQHDTVIKTQAELINQISKNISDFINDCVTYGQNSDNSFATGINNNANVPNTSISNLIQSFEQQYIDYVNENEVYGKQSDENFATGVTNKQLDPQTAVTNVLLALENLDNQYVKKNIQYGYNSDISLGQGLDDKAKIPEKSLQDIVDSLETKLEKFVDKCLGYGQGILKELDKGIKDSKLNKQLLSDVDSLTNKVVDEFKKGFGIASPSKVMYKIGNYLIQGFINGMSATDLNKFIESNLSSFVSTTQRLIKIAASQIGTTDPTKYWNFAGMSGAWCDMFISWCLKQAGIKSDYGSYVPNTLDWYKKNKRFTNTPASGELVFYDWNGDKIPDHIGLVESVLGNGKIKTIEGNTSNPNGGGNGVFEKTRQENSTILGYGIPETGNSSNASGNSGVRDWSSLATLALKLTGHYSNENLKLLLAQINTESSGNPNPPDYKDVNYYEGHPSKGLMQVIPSTFKEYALAPYNKDILDPLSNMIAAIRYTWSRYGGAEGVWGQGHGYASGTDNADAGWHWKNEQGYELMLEPTGQGDFRYINEGSKILTADKTDRLFKFADNPQKYISSSVVDKLSNIKISGENTTPSVINQYSWDKLVLPNVTNAESFIDELQHLDLDATQVITQRN